MNRNWVSWIEPWSNGQFKVTTAAIPQISVVLYNARCYLGVCVSQKHFVYST